MQDSLPHIYTSLSVKTWKLKNCFLSHFAIISPTHVANYAWLWSDETHIAEIFSNTQSISYTRCRVC